MDLASDRQGGGDADGEPFSVTLHPILNQLGGPIPAWRVTGRVRRLFANVDGLVTIDEDLVYDPVSVLRASLPLTTRLPVRTLDVSCRKQFLQASVRADPRTPNRYLVDLAFRRGLAPGEYDFDLLFGGVLANGESIRRAPLRVACRIVEDIQVLPSQLLLGLLNPGEERSDTAVIRSRRGEPFELVEARADSDDVCVRPRPRRPRQVAELSLAVTVRSASPGFHRQTVAAAIRRLDQPTSKIVRLEVLYTIAEEPVVP